MSESVNPENVLRLVSTGSRCTICSCVFTGDGVSLQCEAPLCVDFCLAWGQPFEIRTASESCVEIRRLRGNPVCQVPCGEWIPITVTTFTYSTSSSAAEYWASLTKLFGREFMARMRSFGAVPVTEPEAEKRMIPGPTQGPMPAKLSRAPKFFADAFE